MNQTSLHDEIMELPVLDTHTHLVGSKLCAKDFWEIADYFWLNRELQTAGYPANASELPESGRIDAFCRAYHASRNTMMNVAFTTIMKDLYHIDITDAASIRRADEQIKQERGKAGWAQQVADRLKIERFVVNRDHDAAFEGMRDDALLFPRIDDWMPGLMKDIISSNNRREAMEQAKTTIHEYLQAYEDKGCPGIMTTLPDYEAASHVIYELEDDSRADEIMMMLLHEVCGQLEQRGMFLQLFVGVERRWGTEAAAPVHDPQRIVKLYGLFEKYDIAFELVTASELNNLDVVQAAWNFANVHVGGMWWYNFRASTYLQSMQYRFEAIAPLKSSLIVSDARCIEWTYGKIVVVKRLLARFLDEQVRIGWIGREEALKLAAEWLYGSAAKRYGLL